MTTCTYPKRDLMRAMRFETSVPEDGVVKLRDLPFKAGDQIEVIVLEGSSETHRDDWRRLKGSVLRYENPTDPVGVEDWEALK